MQRIEQFGTLSIVLRIISSSAAASRSSIAVLGMLLVCAAAADAQLGPQSAPKAGLAAEVRGEPITRFELEQKVAERVARFQGQYDVEQLTRDLPILRRQVLDEMIVDRLLIHESEKRGIEATALDRERYIAFEIDRLSKVGVQISSSEEYYRIRGEEHRMTPEQIDVELDSEVRRQKMLAQLLSDNFVSPHELRRHYSANPDQFTTEASYSFRHVFVSRSDTTSLREKLEAIDKSVEQGADFEEIVKAHSEGPRAPRGGLYEVTDKALKDWRDALANAVRTLDEGSVSPRIVTSQGVHYVKLEKRVVGDRLSFEEAQDQIERAILNQRRQAKFKEFRAQLLDAAKNDIKRYIESATPAR